MSGRIYDKQAWRRLRARKLSACPACEQCERLGRIEPAVAVDHVVPVRMGGPALPDLDGLRSLCTRCHARKTARGPEAGAARTSKPDRGCDANGWPIDRNHPWNAGKSLGADDWPHRPSLNFDLVAGPSHSKDKENG